jgi:hypothetical protein
MLPQKPDSARGCFIHGLGLSGFLMYGSAHYAVSTAAL